MDDLEDLPEGCASCKYSRLGTATMDGAPLMLCQRFPPTVLASVPDMPPGPVQLWPQMEAGDWCGEWTPS